LDGVLGLLGGLLSLVFSVEGAFSPPSLFFALLVVRP